MSEQANRPELPLSSEIEALLAELNSQMVADDAAEYITLQQNRAQLTQQLWAGIAKRGIIDAVFNATPGRNLDDLCATGDLEQLPDSNGVLAWSVISPQIQYGLAAAFAQLETQAQNAGWDAQVDTGRLVTSDDDSGFTWCLRQKWNPAAPLIAIRIVERDGVHNVNALNVLSADYQFETDPFTVSN